jgi:hypothetical protein
VLHIAGERVELQSAQSAQRRRERTREGERGTSKLCTIGHCCALGNTTLEWVCGGSCPVGMTVAVLSIGVTGLLSRYDGVRTEWRTMEG